MEVLLAGYNLDSQVIDELKSRSPERADVTPETLSASYARISRDPRPVDELRRAAREEVARARRSNETIIFKMGHHSVAEHAVFNFDIIGVSRLAIEELEHFRLCSYTEKSQRYIALKEDFVIPEEVRCAGLEGPFVETVKAQNALYQSFLARLRPYFFDKHRDRAENPKNHVILEGWAKEDARYVVSLATEGQLGMTVNARNLELLIRRFAARDMVELRELRERLSALAREVAPSILLFTQPGEFDARTYADLENAAAPLLARSRAGRSGSGVELIEATPRGDEKILAALLHSVSGRPYDACAARVARLSARGKRDLFKTAFRRMEFFDAPQREFENADIAFELVVSSSCFAQLKRHRMATLTCQPYDPALGVTVPPSIIDTGLEKEFRAIIARTDEVYEKLRERAGAAAAYVLTNAHRRRVLFKTNLREYYHISRLREDLTAQWEIRRLCEAMTRKVKKAFPLAGLMLGGKDAYPEIYRRLFGSAPATLPPRFWS